MSSFISTPPDVCNILFIMALMVFKGLFNRLCTLNPLPEGSTTPPSVLCWRFFSVLYWQRWLKHYTCGQLHIYTTLMFQETINFITSGSENTIHTHYNKLFGWVVGKNKTKKNTLPESQKTQNCSESEIISFMRKIGYARSSDILQGRWKPYC